MCLRLNTPMTMVAIATNSAANTINMISPFEVPNTVENPRNPAQIATTQIKILSNVISSGVLKRTSWINEIPTMEAKMSIIVEVATKDNFTYPISEPR